MIMSWPIHHYNFFKYQVHVSLISNFWFQKLKAINYLCKFNVISFKTQGTMRGEIIIIFLKCIVKLWTLTLRQQLQTFGPGLSQTIFN